MILKKQDLQRRSDHRYSKSANLPLGAPQKKVEKYHSYGLLYIGQKKNSFLPQESLHAFLHEPALTLQLQLLFFNKDVYVYKSKWQNMTVVLGHKIPLELDYWHFMVTQRAWMRMNNGLSFLGAKR